MRWTHIAERKDCATSGVCADGEVVWSWRSNAGATVVKTLSRLAGDGGNQAMVTGESAKETVKTIAQGMPVDPAKPVVTAACFFCCRRAMGEAITRHSLRPLRFPRAKLLAPLRRERVTRSLKCVFNAAGT